MGDRDVSYDGDAEYECLNCGETITQDTYPGTCPECGSSLRNRRTPLE